MTAFELLAQQLINAVSIGSLYALMAIGLAMVFSILRLINFAHGDLIMVGSYVALLLLLLGLPFGVAAAAGIAASTLAGLLMERVAYRPIRGAHEIAMLLTSFSVTIFLENLAIIIFRPTSRAFPAPDFLRGIVEIGSLRVASLDLDRHRHCRGAPCCPDPLRHAHGHRHRHARGVPGPPCRAAHGHQREPGDRRGVRHRLLHGRGGGGAVERAGGQDRPPHGIQPRAQSLRRIGHRRAGKPPGRRDRRLRPGLPRDPSPGAAPLGPHSLPGRAGLRDPDRAPALQTQRHPRAAPRRRRSDERRAAARPAARDLEQTPPPACPPGGRGAPDRRRAAPRGRLRAAHRHRDRDQHHPRGGPQPFKRLHRCLFTGARRVHGHRRIHRRSAHPAGPA